MAEEEQPPRRRQRSDSASEASWQMPQEFGGPVPSQAPAPAAEPAAASASAGASASPSAGVPESPAARVTERHQQFSVDLKLVRKPEVYDGKDETWSDWKFQMVNWMAAADQR